MEINPSPDDTHRLGSMKPECREVYELRYLAGLSNEQVAERLGLSAQVVAARAVRARAHVERRL